MRERTRLSARRIEPAFVDARGTITDILQDVEITDVTIITTRANAVRGNHYHKATWQHLYMLDGRMRLTTRMPDGDVESIILSSGDLVVTEPNERHAMRALEDSTFLVLSRGPRGGGDYESDTYRLAPEELLERPGG